MMISDKQKQMLLALQPTDITKSFILTTFGRSSKTKNTPNGPKLEIIAPKFKTTDTFYITPDEYFVKEKTLTTVGRFVYNKLIVERELQNILGYMNSAIDAGQQKKIESILSEALINDKIDTRTFAQYINRIQWLGMQFNNVICSSFTDKSIIPLKNVTKARDELMSKNADKIQNGDVITSVKIEADLLKMAKDQLKNDPSIDLYTSGARGSFNNNYKAMYISKGPVYNPINQKWDVIHNSYTEGLEKKDMQAYGNSLVLGQYAKSLGSPVAGYLFKRLNASFQSIVADVPGSDCGTKLTLKIRVTPKNKLKFIDRYIVEGGKLVLLNHTNIEKYVGKDINLRSTMYCKGTSKCSKCIGERFYKLGLRNVGLLSTRASTTILNMNMKKMHDSTASLHEINLDNISF